jgi:hypothetical protein
MSKATVLYLILLMEFSLSAQTIALNGKVTNQSGNAVVGAVVTLESRQLADTTDATGAFFITGGTSAVHSAPILSGEEAVSLKNGSVVVRLSKQDRVRVDFFDMQGNLLERVLDNSVTPGNYRFDMMKRQLAAKMMVVRVTVGQHTYSFRYLPLVNGIQFVNSSVASSSGAVLAKMDATVDSLKVTALGYKTKFVQVSSYSETINVTLETEGTVQCTASKSANMNVSGNGPHKVVVETNSDPGIKEGTIYRPEDLGPGKMYPIFIWGEGACSLDGKSNSAAMAQIASHGYFVIADGTPGGSGTRSMDLATITKPARAFVTWAIAENRKPCSVYYQSLDTTKVAGNGFSCGGFFGQALAGDPRTTTWGVSSSGSFGDAPDLWNSVHTPVLILEGSKDISSAGGTGAYTNGLRDYNGIAPLKWPVYFISNKNMGHGGDLGSTNGGEFTKINLAWLNWWLKGDTGATGKGVLVGSTCKYCTDNNWEVKSANIP